MNPKLVLGIETAIGGGSLAIVSDDRVLKTASGEVSRSEQVITGISSILKEAEVQLPDLSHIAVSLGPGSFTGIRIAIATALGLARSAQTNCVGVSLFEAVATTAVTDYCGVIISLGRSYYGFQKFLRSASEIRPLSGPTALSEAEVRSILETEDSGCFLLCSAGSENLFLHTANIVEVNENLAGLVALRAPLVRVNNRLEPLYLGK